MEHFLTYFNALQAANLAEMTEHSLRPELKNLLTAIASGVDNKIKILHEGKREGQFGAPDFKVTRIENIIGYVENKKVGEPLDHILKSDQLKKYQRLSDNILLTNYLEWIWLHKGNIQRETLCAISDLEQKRAKLDPHNVAAVEQLVIGFLSFAPEGIGKPKELAEALAIRGKLLKEFLAEELHRQEHQDARGKLFGLYETFQKYVFHELTLEEFADAFSQNLIYGLFLAKLTADTAIITLSNAETFIPANFELIRELVDFLKDLNRKEYTDIRWVIEEVLTIFNTMNFCDIKIALSFKDLTGFRNRSGREEADDPYAAKDPYIYFYEDFLAAYDKHLRKSKGVYYTPPQVVNFIVRAVDDILQSTFGLHDGLADHENVTVLDFATGTGTFLLEVMRQILRNYPQKAEKELVIREHILKNLYGFEYLIAPYTIAHLKLSQFLKDQEYEFAEGERLQIFLTNTLEPTDRQLNIALLPALTEETKQAQNIKDQPILVIMGNPPYSASSQNKQTILGLDLLKDYKEGLNEKTINALSDDYVKFIRFAHYKIEKQNKGIIAIITNNSFIDGIVHRKMREKLCTDFDQIYILNLHGNSLKKENDENVFDIRVGVNISIFVKTEERLKETEVYYFSTKENRIEERVDKYRFLLENDLNSINWTRLKPEKPNFWFTYKNLCLQDTYRNYWTVNDIFRIFNGGIETGKDSFIVGFIPEQLEDRIRETLESDAADETDIRNKYDLKDTPYWKLKTFKNAVFETNKIIKYDYRPFDTRHIFYEPTVLRRGKASFSVHFIKNDNIGLIVPRQCDLKEFRHVFVTNRISDSNLIGTARKFGAGIICPLYTYETPEGLFTKGSDFIKTENFTKAFRQFIDRRYHKHYTPEEILGYIYAVLHSPTYRAKYAEFLKIDFPRIPFPEDLTGFENLSGLGWQLIQVHLLNEIPAYDLGSYQGEGDNTVIKPDYRKTQNSERLYINTTQYFDYVPEDVYRFQIGGYQVLDKYLKDRKGRTLTLSEVKNIRNIVNVLAFTIEQMRKIDEISSAWI